LFTFVRAEDKSGTEPRKLEGLAHRVVAMVTIYGAQGGYEEGWEGVTAQSSFE